MRIPQFGFGTYKITEASEVLSVLDDALKAGYRLFDTAKVYNNEKEIGSALKILLPKHNLTREDITIISKLHPTAQNTFDETIRRVYESLDLLQTDYIDIYLIHYPKPNECQNEDENNAEYRRLTYCALEKCLEDGKIRTIGVSNYEIRHLEEIRGFAKHLPVLNQIELHPHFTRKELREYCRSNGIIVQAFSSLARHNEQLFGSEIVGKLAEKYEVPATSIILAWATNQNILIIPKSTNFNRMVQNLNVPQLSIPEIEALSELNINKNYVGRTTGWLVQ
ncbi:unnamed protein product [Caenorhabditis angaria]|uniref:NADP-dependent oxidoreductase domain-containing protein n=1 Tax=Caenorhabditis angaria TaxID=860376 RepID=A0A9P1N4Y7_9PELO|nr:unnamed protein product [Caenorhabditis angaria]